MRHIVTLSFILLASIPSFAQRNVLPKYDYCDIINAETYQLKVQNEFKLIIISVAGCGYCSIALDHILKKNIAYEVEVIVLEFGEIEVVEKLYANYFSDFKIINAKGCKIKGIKERFFPRFRLYQNDKLLWKNKGWKNDIPQKILHSVKQVNSKKQFY